MKCNSRKYIRDPSTEKLGRECDFLRIDFFQILYYHQYSEVMHAQYVDTALIVNYILGYRTFEKVT
jgi:hypothetical protein